MNGWNIGYNASMLLFTASLSSGDTDEEEEEEEEEEGVVRMLSISMILLC